MHASLKLFAKLVPKLLRRWRNKPLVDNALNIGQSCTLPVCESYNTNRTESIEYRGSHANDNLPINYTELLQTTELEDNLFSLSKTVLNYNNCYK